MMLPESRNKWTREGIIIFMAVGFIPDRIQVFDELFLVKVLADEDNLLHAVAIVLVPVSQQAGLAFHQFYDSSSGWVAYQSPASEICFCRPACSNRNDMSRLWAK